MAAWQQVEALLELALAVKPERRVKFLMEACEGDQELHREVQSLLVYEARVGQFLLLPALELLVTSGIDPSEPAPPRLLSGTVIGPYQVVALLGGGGMGDVYQAIDTRLHRQVALKFVAANQSNHTEALERFRREARAVSALNHPKICTLYDIGEYEERPFLVMELLQGQTLKERLAGGIPPPAEVAALGIQICRALEAAHAKGIVHRDLKPANICITSDGRVKVLDFGVAKLLTDRHETPGAPATCLRVEDTITISGGAIGTAPYMSPEQASGNDADARSDLFSLGATMYQMATGVRPFKAETPALTLEAVRSQAPVPPRQLTAELPAQLECVILKALEKKREMRYQNASEMRIDLELLERPASRSQRWLPAMAVILLLTAGLTLGGIRLGRLRANSTPTHGKMRQVTNNTPEDPIPRASISPDGAYIAYVDLVGLHIRNINTGDTRTIPAAPGCCFR